VGFICAVVNTVVKSRNMGCVGHVAQWGGGGGENKNAYRVLVEKPERKR
jgi:hypothetical protein